MEVQYYYNEEPCQMICFGSKRNGNPCRNKAFYIQDDGLRCNIHSDLKLRKLLPKHPDYYNPKKYKEYLRNKNNDNQN